MDQNKPYSVQQFWSLNFKVMKAKNRMQLLSKPTKQGIACLHPTKHGKANL